VAWSEWSDESFARARAEDKPVVLDLGAAWSYGCAVMDRETYGDPEVVELLNRDYVPVRVDSDRRPDLHERYNLGGWPTTAFLTPDAKLIGGGTYLERNQMKQLLVQLKTGFKAHREKIAEEIARRDEKIAEVLGKDLPGVAAITMEIFRKTVRGVLGSFDTLYAGFGEAPKFPLTASLRIILQAWQETEGPDLEAVLIRTLDAMADRGMYDHERGGFFHYVTNNTWTSARFEKLCEENALLIRLYLDAGVATGQEKYVDKAVHAMAWATETLLDPGRGVFAGSQRGDDDYYGASSRERAKRKPPPVDRTVFVPASAAMAQAWLRASEVLDDEGFAETALRGLEWLRSSMVQDGKVAHYHDGAPRILDLARDPVALALAFLDAHDHTGEAKWIDAAEALLAGLPARFYSEVERGLIDRAVDAGGLGDLARPRRNMVENAQAAEGFARLWTIRGNEEHRRWAERLLRSFPDFLDGYGHETAEYAVAADWLVRPAVEVRAGALRPYVPRRRVAR
jgi:uncharacterized protein YyaL (SSP411 family)